MIGLVKTKRMEFISELEVDDPRELMNSEVTKWEKISLSVNAAPGITCYRSPDACKYKWHTLLLEYKCIADLHKDTCMNSMVYFELSFAQRRERTLSKNFDMYVYRDMNEWLKHKPTMMPPHFRDLLNPNDHNFIPPNGAQDGNIEDYGKSPLSGMSSSEPTLHAYASAAAHEAATESSDTWEEGPQETEATLEGNQTLPSFPTGPPLSRSAATFQQYIGGVSTRLPPMPIVDLNYSAPASPITAPGQPSSPLPQTCTWIGTPPLPTQSPPSRRTTAPDMQNAGKGPNDPPPTVGPRRAHIPHPPQASHGGQVPLGSGTSGSGMEGTRESDPHVLSSSDTSGARSNKPTIGSIGVRRKNNAGIKLVVDATLEGSDRLVAGLKEINDTAKVMKREEMDLELRIHDENMHYKLQRDQ
jgi:hypothetical protein